MTMPPVPPTPPRQSTAFEAVVDSIAMKLLGFGFVVLGALMVVIEMVTIPVWNPTPRQSVPLVFAYLGLIVVGSAMVVGTRFVQLLAGLLGAVGKYLPGRHGGDQ